MALTKTHNRMIEGATVNVLDYGADPNGVNDSTSAIVAAINALPSTGGSVYFPEGDYLTDKIVIPSYPKCVRFFGDEKYNSVLVANAANQTMLESAGITSGVGGTRFSMEDMGFKPHASSNGGTCIDMQNMTASMFREVAFLVNGGAYWDLLFYLFSQDTPTAINCYYNLFDGIYVNRMDSGVDLPANRVMEIDGACGNHTIRRLIVSGSTPSSTGNIISVGQYCRQNQFLDCHFEGVTRTSGNIISDSGYGTKIVRCYWENTGSALYVAAENETGSRQWTVVEQCAFAANTVDITTTFPRTNGVTFRDNYAFGSNADVLDFIHKVETQNTLSFPYDLDNYGAIEPFKAYFGDNSENFLLSLNDNGSEEYLADKSAKKITLQTPSSDGGQLIVASAQVGTAGNAITYTTDVAISDATGTGFNVADTVIKVNKDNTSGRSINAAGTINASGADYAEYMTKAGSFTIAKGDICGVDVNGLLTNVYASAISFVVKSTDPSYVGGDKWGSWDTFGDDVDAAALEAERAMVDRIAFCGQVPVNVNGASVGDYIVPVDDNGSITGQSVTNPTLEQYMMAVGKVIAIEDDGRAKIIVKIS